MTSPWIPDHGMDPWVWALKELVYKHSCVGDKFVRYPILLLDAQEILVDAVYAHIPEYMTTEDFRVRYEEAGPNVPTWKHFTNEQAKTLIYQLDPTFDLDLWQLNRELNND